MTAEALVVERTHIAHDNGIHEFIFPDSSDETLDWWFEQLDEIYVQHAGEKIVCFLYVVGDSLPSLAAVMTRVRAQNRRLSGRPATCTAVLYNSPTTMTYLNIFAQIANVVGRDTTRFFRTDQRQDAIEWLLQGS